MNHKDQQTLVIVMPLPVAIYWAGHFIVEYGIENSQQVLTFQLLSLLFDSVLLYLIIGLTSLKQHAMQIYRPLNDGDMSLARHFTGYLVSRDMVLQQRTVLARILTLIS
ncbi:cobalamin biosynthesis protein [Psychrobium sp. nBUS_13]|uniref:cobalamin biosynthesis protein n=1 Tax=Psychrobium sp. nBUS_13 TaxID=3395319 RepID=UPI003EBD5A14